MGRGDLALKGLLFASLALFLVSIVYPLYFVVVASFSDPAAIYQGRVWLYPVEPTLDGYREIIEYRGIWLGYRNTLFYTTAGTAINLALTVTAAYSLSRRGLPGRRLINLALTVTMFFSGGLIPSYLIVKGLGMLNTPWALLVPNAVSVWNLIITRTFFMTSVPEEVYESASLDGCSHTRYLVQILLPLSTAIIAVIVLFYSLAHWNSFFSALMYLKDANLYPLQLVLRDVLISAEALEKEIQTADDFTSAQRTRQLAELIKYGVIVVSSLPFMIVYPFLQKYFQKGVTLGAIKG